MAFKFAALSVLFAVANAGYLGAPAAVEYHAPAVEYHAAPAVAVGHGPIASTAIGSQTQSVYRSADGNHAVSTYSKAVDTAFSSVRKYDTRVSNDAIALAHAPAVATYAHAPAVATVAHAPVVAHAPAVATVAHAPVVAHAPAVATVAHAPVVAQAPAVVAHTSYAPTYAASYAPSYAASYAPAVAKVAAPASLLGVAYSAAPTVAHLSYSNGYGINYHY